MTRIGLVTILVVSLAWQGFAVAFLAAATDVHGDAEHAIAHLQKQGHHHHHDGSVHSDDSVESTLHLLADTINVVSLLPQSVLAPLPAGSDSLVSRSLPAVSSCCLEGPLRPPQATV